MGAQSEGARVVSAGVVPTPAVAYLTPFERFDLGIVISASHNPFDDNGIKVFSGAARSSRERLEREIEAIVADSSWTVRESPEVSIETADYSERLSPPRPPCSARRRNSPWQTPGG